MNASVIIIGSGVAGLSAARRLCERGWTNVKILEARSYIGGRTDTRTVGSSQVDFGAQWIHGQENNPVYELAKLHDLVDDNAHSYLSSIYQFQQLKTDEEKDAALDVCQFFRKLARDDLDSYASKNLAEILKKGFCKYLQDKPSNLKSIMKSVYDLNVKFECSLNGSPNLEDVSALLLDNYVECGGNPVTELKAKYASFVKVLTDSIPTDCILFDMEVKKIVWGNVTESPAVKIETADGTSFEADHVIVTIPLGYLKTHMLEMFHPSLPIEKQDAIKEMGFGTLNKIFLHFSEPFWSPGDIYNVLWLQTDLNSDCQSDEAIMNLKESTKLRAAPTDWTRGLIHFTYVHRQPNVLCAWVSGEGANEMELVPLDKVANDCQRILSYVLEDQNIPLPTQVDRSNWHTDPLFRGSYSYLSVGCERKNLLPKHIAKPVEEPRHNHQSYPFLLFAGEATHDQFYSTVHGAYDSGAREADRLLAFYK